MKHTSALHKHIRTSILAQMHLRQRIYTSPHAQMHLQEHECTSTNAFPRARVYLPRTRMRLHERIFISAIAHSMQTRIHICPSVLARLHGQGQSKSIGARCATERAEQVAQENMRSKLHEKASTSTLALGDSHEHICTSKSRTRTLPAVQKLHPLRGSVDKTFDPFCGSQGGPLRGSAS